MLVLWRDSSLICCAAGEDFSTNNSFPPPAEANTGFFSSVFVPSSTLWPLSVFCFFFLLTSGRRTLPEASSSSFLTEWWLHLCRQRFSAMRSCQTLFPTQNTSQVPILPHTLRDLTAAYHNFITGLSRAHSSRKLPAQPLLQAHLAESWS